MHVLDVIELERPIAGWPAGSVGTVLEDSVPGLLLVEFGDEEPELIEVPVDAVRVAAAAA